MQKIKRCKLCFNCVRVSPEFRFTCLRGMWLDRLYSLDTVNSSNVLDGIACICDHFDDDENSSEPINWGDRKKVEGYLVREIRLGEEIWQRVEKVQ